MVTVTSFQYKIIPRDTEQLFLFMKFMMIIMVYI